VVYTWTVNTTPLTLNKVPPGGNLGCNPTPPTDYTATNGVTVTAACGTALASFGVTHADVTSGCTVTRTYTISAADSCGNTGSATVVYTWTVNTTPLTLNKVPPGGNLGCNPTPPTDYTATNGVTVTAACGTALATFGVTHADVTSGCTVTRTYTISAKDSCGNTGSATVVYTWTANTTPPVLSSVPTGGYLGCSSSNAPSDATIKSAVSATAHCGTATITVSHVDATNGCTGSRTFTITAADSCNNTASATVVYTWTAGASGLVVTCPPNVTFVTNFCRMYCTFGPGDWGGSCNGGYYNNNNWWQNWCSQNSSSQCGSSWSNWWNSCGGNSQGSNWWNNFTSDRPSGWCSGWSSGYQQGNWNGGWNNGWNGGWNNYNQGYQQWVPCNGNNPDTILNNCFSGIYSGSCKIGQPAGGYCLTFTSVNSLQRCLNLTGPCGVLNGSAVNPSTCSAGSFCAQVLALQLNCDFGDGGNDSRYFGRCGDLVYNDSSSPCNGKKVRDILGTCNNVLGGGACPQGCSVQSLCDLCSNFNQCFKGCQVSSWCTNHLCPVYIPPVSLTGTATVSDACSSTKLTNYDTVTAESCRGTYLVSRLWVAVDACGNSNSCTQLITVSQTNSASLSGLVALACSGDTNLSDNEGLANVTVTLEDSNGKTVGTTTTSSSGSYSFSSLALGTYTVVVTPPGGYTQTYPASGNNQTSVTLTACEGLTGVNFAYIGSSPGVQLIKTGPCLVTNKQTITYTFAVTNTGNTCETLTVTDPLLGGTIFTQSSVAPGQGFVFTAKFVVSQTNGCLTNTATATGTPPTGTPVTSTSTTVAVVTTKCSTRTICGNFNSQNPYGGWVWCNAHVSANPGKKCTVYCQNASVTLTCNDGKTYTYPVPDCQINFSPNCSTGSCSFDGTKWTTTLPCNGDDEIFLSGCGIPWQSDFANCHQVCWTGTFCSDTPGTSCNWQWSAACYNTDLSNCGSVSVKPCHQTYCGYPGGDHAGTPENCKSYVQGGACGGGGSNYTGSWSSTDSFTCN
jgi:uncharacterized repeat protein (TIGR01451 family)